MFFKQKSVSAFNSTKAIDTGDNYYHAKYEQVRPSSTKYTFPKAGRSGKTRVLVDRFYDPVYSHVDKNATTINLGKQLPSVANHEYNVFCLKY
jgi:hypothetical protein